MLNAVKNYDDVDSWKTVMFLYNSYKDKSEDSRKYRQEAEKIRL